MATPLIRIPFPLGKSVVATSGRYKCALLEKKKREGPERERYMQSPTFVVNASEF